jgi:hypothetical protein
MGFHMPSEGCSSLIDNPKAIANPEGREVSKVIAVGKVII